MSEKTKQFVGSVKAKTDFAVLNNADIDRDQIKEWLVQDVKRVAILVNDILNTPECIENLTDVFYKRYQDFHKENAIKEMAEKDYSTVEQNG
ncbi:hypothetical protein [Apis mellifera associated microvirus 35]|nr:hypothetical protein [Apis mellifera associated microvirus 35]